jgi:ribosomal protein S18 acetylase RimI-like enzyme
MVGIIIREFNFPEDYPESMELWKNSGAGITVAKSDSPNEIQKKLNYSPDLFLVAELSGKLIGTVIGGYDGRRGMIYHLAVRKQFQNQGIGRKLMNEVESRLRSKGCLKSYLMVTKDNTQVIDYYQKMGWNVMDVCVLGKELD